MPTPIVVLRDPKEFAERIRSIADQRICVGLVIQPEEIQSGSVDNAVERLSVLSDSVEYTRRFAHCLTYLVNGYGADLRPLFEIPECCTYFRQLARAWPYWLHFLEKNGASIGNLIRFHAHVAFGLRGDGIVTAGFEGAIDAESAMNRLLDGTKSLYAKHGLSQARFRVTTHLAVRSLRKWFNSPQ